MSIILWAWGVQKKVEYNSVGLGRMQYAGAAPSRLAYNLHVAGATMLATSPAARKATAARCQEVVTDMPSLSLLQVGARRGWRVAKLRADARQG